jgi:hypothetical protein
MGQVRLVSVKLILCARATTGASYSGFTIDQIGGITAPYPADAILMLAPAGRSRKPRRPQRIKFNLMESADCEPTLALRASAISRHVNRAFDPSRNDMN